MKQWQDLESSYLDWLKQKTSWTKTISLKFVLAAKHFWIFTLSKGKNPMQSLLDDVIIWLSYVATDGVREKQILSLGKMISMFFKFLSYKNLAPKSTYESIKQKYVDAKHSRDPRIQENRKEFTHSNI